MKKITALICFSFIFLTLACNVFAEPTGGWVYISTMRPYSGTDTKAFINVGTTALCNTDTFAINTTAPNGKEMYAVALAAVIAKRAVALEVSNNTGCTGYGTLLQSIYINGN
jgi:hypothetical protein